MIDFCNIKECSQVENDIYTIYLKIQNVCLECQGERQTIHFENSGYSIIDCQSCHGSGICKYSFTKEETCYIKCIQYLLNERSRLLEENFSVKQENFKLKQFINFS